MWNMRALPVLKEADFRAAAAREGSTIEILCIKAPTSESRFAGEWAFYVVLANGERYGLFTQRIRERVFTSAAGVLAMAISKLDLDEVKIPAVAGAVADGMRSGPSRGDPLERDQRDADRPA